MSDDAADTVTHCQKCNAEMDYYSDLCDSCRDEVLGLDHEKGKEVPRGEIRSSLYDMIAYLVERRADRDGQR